jgi:vancomycin resistance protein YoaR
MSTEPVTEQEVEKLREWVDDLRIPKPVEAPKSPAVHDPKPQVHVLKASAEISVGAKLVQKIIESMDLRNQERARLVAALKSKEVEVERENVQANKHFDEAYADLEEEIKRRANILNADFQNARAARQADLHARQQQIEHIDRSLGQLRTQLNAELGKLDPERDK